MKAALSTMLMVATIATASPLAPRAEDSTLGDPNSCTGTTWAHVYGYEDGCEKGFQKFSYEIADSCQQRCANTDGRVHYINNDGSGAAGGVTVIFFDSRDCNSNNISPTATLYKNQCMNVNTGFNVQSMRFDLP